MGEEQLVYINECLGEKMGALRENEPDKILV